MTRFARAVIGGILGALAFIGIIIGIIFYIRKRQEDADGPPKHKPPPPVKAGSSTEMLNKPSEPPTATETVPLSPGEVYYEPTGGEPVTNLDDETTGALNGGAPPVLDDNELRDHAGHHGNDLESSNRDPTAANISRGESFVSPAISLRGTRTQRPPSPSPEELLPVLLTLQLLRPQSALRQRQQFQPLPLFLFQSPSLRTPANRSGLNLKPQSALPAQTSSEALPIQQDEHSQDPRGVVAASTSSSQGDEMRNPLDVGVHLFTLWLIKRIVEFILVPAGLCF
ncbi:hypothetical protein D9C73_022477 [Collichthys lucidus]|uniref:Uncharacterized protein n=1 Tax=Collichthys lucidus TaxID=240159 RepID=A0A4V6ASP7_COLLU|nr:hypothetical protein D9C73_022477 [Collichthys lucidus]